MFTVGLWALFCSSASAGLMSIPNIRKLTNDSNVIAVVKAGETRNLGRAAFLDAQGKQLQGWRFATAFQIEEILTGSVGERIEVQFNEDVIGLSPTPPMNPAFSSGERALLFLHCTDRDCSFTKSETPGFRIAGESVLVPAPPQPVDIYLRVIQRIAAGLFSDSGNVRQRGESPSEVFLLGRESNPYIDTIFKAALAEPATQTDAELRGELIAALIWKKDISVLPQLNDFLFSGDCKDPACGNLILSLQSVDWHLSLPIAARALQLPSARLRTTAAEAIRGLHMAKYVRPPNEMSVPATAVLLPAIHDPDPDVAFEVMQTLGILNARLDERPTTTTQDAQWTACVNFWDGFQNQPETK